jgi:hypothetical protein
MKKVLSLLAVGAAFTLLGGCATAPTFGVPDDQIEVVDTQKIQLVEDWARRANVTVIWYRKPTRLVPKTAAVNS